MATFKGVGTFSPDDFTIKLKAMQQIADRNQRTFEAAAQRAHQTALQTRAQQAAAAQQLKALELDAAKNGLKLSRETTGGVNIPFLGNVGGSTQTTLSPDPNSPVTQFRQAQVGGIEARTATDQARLEALELELETLRNRKSLEAEIAEIEGATTADLVPRIGLPEEKAAEAEVIRQQRLEAARRKYPLASRRREVEDLGIRKETAGVKSAEAEAERAGRKIDTDIESVEKTIGLKEAQTDLTKAQTPGSGAGINAEFADNVINQNAAMFSDLIGEGKFSPEEVRSVVASMLQGAKPSDIGEIPQRASEFLEARLLRRQAGKDSRDAQIANLAPVIGNEIEKALKSLPLTGIESGFSGRLDLKNTIEMGQVGKLKDAINFVKSSMESQGKNSELVTEALARTVGQEFVSKIVYDEKRTLFGTPPVEYFFGGLPVFDKGVAAEIISDLGLEEQFRTMLDDEDTFSSYFPGK